VKKCRPIRPLNNPVDIGDSLRVYNRIRVVGVRVRVVEAVMEDKTNDSHRRESRNRFHNRRHDGYRDRKSSRSSLSHNCLQSRVFQSVSSSFHTIQRSVSSCHSSVLSFLLSLSIPLAPLVLYQD